MKGFIEVTDKGNRLHLIQVAAISDVCVTAGYTRIRLNHQSDKGSVIVLTKETYDEVKAKIMKSLSH